MSWLADLFRVIFKKVRSSSSAQIFEMKPIFYVEINYADMKNKGDSSQNDDSPVALGNTNRRTLQSFESDLAKISVSSKAYIGATVIGLIGSLAFGLVMLSSTFNVPLIAIASVAIGLVFSLLSFHCLALDSKSEASEIVQNNGINSTSASQFSKKTCCRLSRFDSSKHHSNKSQSFVVEDQCSESQYYNGW